MVLRAMRLEGWVSEGSVHARWQSSTSTLAVYFSHSMLMGALLQMQGKEWVCAIAHNHFRMIKVVHKTGPKPAPAGAIDLPCCIYSQDRRSEQVCCSAGCLQQCSTFKQHT